MILAALLLAIHPVEPETAIDAERAFAADAQKIGQWAAFSKWAHEEGVLIGQRNLPAKEFAAEASKSEPDLAVHWWPTHSIISCDGNMAYNYGPYYSPADASFGRFNTIWTRTEAGWRYLLDWGSDLDEPLPASEVSVRRADCSEQDGYPPAIAYPGADQIVGSSNDGNMFYSLSRFENGLIRLEVNIWNGSEWENVANLEQGND